MPQIIIDATAQQAQRITAALGRERDLRNEDGTPRSATAGEVKAYLVDVLKRLVHGSELRAAQEAVAQPSSLDIT